MNYLTAEAKDHQEVTALRDLLLNIILNFLLPKVTIAYFPI